MFSTSTIQLAQDLVSQKMTGYVRNEEDVARDLYEALRQFFTIYSEYQSNDFYITGVSYAGKYVTAIAHKIHTEKNKPKAANITLK